MKRAPRAFARALAGTLAVLLLLVASLALSVLMHLNLPAARALAMREANAILAPVLSGQIAIDRLDRLSAMGIAGAHVTVRDPEGKIVIVASDLAARLDTPALLLSLLRSSRPIVVDIQKATAGAIDVSLASDERGLALVRAFTPRATASPPPPPGAPSTPGRTVALTIASMTAAVKAHDGPRGLFCDGAARGNLRAGVGGFHLDTSFAGEAMAVPVDASFGMDGDRLDAAVDSRPFDATAVAPLVTPLVLRGRATLHAEAHGPLAALATKAHLTLDGATIDADALLTVGPSFELTGTARVGALDTAAIFPPAPPTSLDATLRLSFAQPSDGPLSGSAELDAARARVAGVDLPRFGASASFRGDDASGALAIDEPGAHTDAKLTATLSASPLIGFEANAHAPDLREVTRLGGGYAGALDVHAKGTLALATMTVKTTVDAHAHDLTASGLRIGRADLRADARGPLLAPMIDGSVDARQANVAGVLIGHATVRVSGPALSPRVRIAADGPAATHADADARVTFGKAIAVDDANAHVARNGVDVRVHAAAVRIAGGGVRVDDARIEGLGRPATLSIDKRPSSLRVKVDAPGLGLRRISSLAPGMPSMTGWASASGDVTFAGGRAEGELSLRAVRVTIAEHAGVDARASATIHGRSLSVAGEVRVPGVIDARVNAPDVTLAGDPVRPASWVGAVGRGEIAGEATLEKVMVLLPAHTLPLDTLAGSVAFRAVLARAAHEKNPSASVSLSTAGLVLARGELRSTGADLDVDAKLDATSGAVSVGLRAHDAAGTLIEAAAESGLSELLSQPLTRIPLLVRASIPPRELAAMPAWVPTLGLVGRVDVTASLGGTLLAPSLQVNAHARGLLPKNAQTKSKKKNNPADVDVEAHYDGARAEVVAGVRGSSGEQLVAAAELRVASSDLFGATDVHNVPWTASARANLGGVRIESLPWIQDVRVRGALRGEIAIDDLHHAGRARVEVRVDDLRSGKVRGATATLRALLADEHAIVAARIDHGDGMIALDATSPMHWGAELLPQLDESQPARLALRAKSFRLAAIAPLVRDTLPELDGRFDSDLLGTLGPVGAPPTLEGNASVRNGSLDLPTFSQQLRNVNALVRIAEGGAFVIRDVSAEALGGQITATVKGQVKGLTLASAQAKITIPSRAPVPVSFEGDSLGDVWGEIDATARQDEKIFAIDARVPSLHLRMPDVERGSVQNLNVADGVRVGVRRSDGTLGPIGKVSAKPSAKRNATPVRVAVRFGSDVEIRKGTMVRVQMRGAPVIDVTDKTRLSGQIELTGGTLDVEGKRFSIDSGTVTFLGDDPSNPTVYATASWDANDGTRVYADYIGPLKTGKLTLRSEPSLSQNEILGLILFGSTEGIAGSSASSPSTAPSGVDRAAGAGAGVGGAVATQGLNKALNQLTALDVSTRVDTSADTPRFDVVWQLSRNVSAQIAAVLGTPAPGTNPDLSFLSIDWRFLGKWSLETTVGDAGTSMVDVLWRHRY